MILQIILFAAIGVAMEVVFTALMDYPKSRDARLTGYSYVWMLPIYGLTPVFLRFLYLPLSAYWLPLRLGIYVVLLLAMEYATGWLLRRFTGECPWERHYRGKKWAVHGLMRLDFAPAWAVACLIFEKIYVALLPLGT